MEEPAPPGEPDTPRPPHATAIAQVTDPESTSVDQGSAGWSLGRALYFTTDDAEVYDFPRATEHTGTIVVRVGAWTAITIKW